MYSIYISNLDQKIDKILVIFKNNMGSLKVITSDMVFVGLQYKNYMIKDYKIIEVEKLLNLKTARCFTLGGISKQLLKQFVASDIKLNLNAAEEIILREHFYQNRVEVFKLLGLKPKDSTLISIDFNHLYLNLMQQKLPTKKLNIQKNHKIDLKRPGFYSISYTMPENIEPILPNKLEGLTYFNAGKGSGVYWHEEILYFEKHGGLINAIEVVCLFDEELEILKPFMQYLLKLPNRSIRKGLANQLFGHFGMKTWKYRKELRLNINIGEDPSPIRRLRQLGEFSLVEMNQLEYVYNPVSNIAWALIITARARIQIHKLIYEAQEHGLTIYFVNLDELIVESNENVKLLMFNWGSNIKIKKVSRENEAYLINMQLNALYKRQLSDTKEGSYKAWKK